ncbi:hypothetical protein EV284_1181 [Streptomyces sp. BK022]|nr:hypothetical protein EV284_1181 [Streptomyces sp. BK022]
MNPADAPGCPSGPGGVERGVGNTIRSFAASVMLAAAVVLPGTTPAHANADVQEGRVLSVRGHGLTVQKAGGWMTGHRAGARARLYWGLPGIAHDCAPSRTGRPWVSPPRGGGAPPAGGGGGPPPARGGGPRPVFLWVLLGAPPEPTPPPPGGGPPPPWGGPPPRPSGSSSCPPPACRTGAGMDHDARRNVRDYERLPQHLRQAWGCPVRRLRGGPCWRGDAIQPGALERARVLPPGSPAYRALRLGPGRQGTARSA